MQFSRWIVARRSVLLVLIALALLGLFRFKLDVEVLNLLPPRDEVTRGLLLYQRHFLNSSELIVTLQASSAEAASEAVEKAVRTLRANPALVRDVFWQPPWNDSLKA